MSLEGEENVDLPEIGVRANILPIGFTIQSRQVCAQQEHRVSGGQRKEVLWRGGHRKTRIQLAGEASFRKPCLKSALRRGQISTIQSKGQPQCPRMKAGNTRSYATVHMQRTLSLLSSELRLSNWLGHTLLFCYVCLGEHQCPNTADCRNGVVMGSSCMLCRAGLHPTDHNQSWPIKEEEDQGPGFYLDDGGTGALCTPGKLPPNEAHPQLLKLTFFSWMWATYKASVARPFVFGCCRESLEGGHIAGICSKIPSLWPLVLGLSFKILLQKWKHWK